MSQAIWLFTGLHGAGTEVYREVKVKMIFVENQFLRYVSFSKGLFRIPILCGQVH